MQRSPCLSRLVSCAVWALLLLCVAADDESWPLSAASAAVQEGESGEPYELGSSLSLRGGAAHSFERVMLLEQSSETSASVSIGDLNHDGHLDIVLAKGRHWPLHNRVLLNDGKCSFKATNIGTAPDRTYTAAIADMNGDGHLDVVVSNDRPDAKLLYFNDGTGRFSPTGSFGRAEWSTRYVTVADVNKDNMPDILVANRGGPKGTPSYVCLNDGKGTFPSCEALPGTQSVTVIVAADLDSDGSVDLLVPHRDGGRSSILWGDGSGRFRHNMAFGAPRSWTRTAAVGDLNGDGIADIIVGDMRRGSWIYFGKGKRMFHDPIPLQGGQAAPTAIELADMNRDGKLDIVVGYEHAVGSVYLNTGTQGSGTTAVSFEEVRWGDAKGKVYGVAVGDLDNDGWLDIAAARSGAPNAVWFGKGGEGGGQKSALELLA